MLKKIILQSNRVKNLDNAVGVTFKNDTYSGIMEYTRLNQTDIIPKMVSYVTRVHSVHFAPAYSISRQVPCIINAKLICRISIPLDVAKQSLQPKNLCNRTVEKRSCLDVYIIPHRNLVSYCNCHTKYLNAKSSNTSQIYQMLHSQTNMEIYGIPTWKNIYVTYMSKYMKYIFAKSCIIRMYFAYIFYIKVRYIRQNIFDI